jgi:hypothetical protein
MAKTITKTNRPRLTLDIPPALRGGIKMAAAAQGLSVSAYVTLLDRAVPAGRALKRAADGTITADKLHRFEALRAQQTSALSGGLRRLNPREQNGARDSVGSAEGSRG